MELRTLYRSSKILGQHLRHSGNLKKEYGIAISKSSARFFRNSARSQVIKPFLLADIGEGIRECEVIQWFVEPEARVEQFDKLCEVQSDKASVEITSRFDGVIKKLHYEAGQMALVGKPLVDIDIQGELTKEDIEPVIPTEDIKAEAGLQKSAAESPSKPPTEISQIPSVKEQSGRSKHALLATPAVRHLIKELEVNIADVVGTGKDGRVMKDDVYQFAKARDTQAVPQKASSTAPETPQETTTTLTGIQLQMFKSMTRSTSIPHFLYADEIDFTALTQLRSRLNAKLAISPIQGISKISYMPFIIKAMSLTLHQYPILNSHLSTTDPSKPTLTTRPQHNIGIAIDTPQGLLVPVLKNVSTLTILEIATNLSHLQSLAINKKLSASDLKGGTITVSNIGNIGGTYLSPVIVDSEVAILAMGRVRRVPVVDGEGRVGVGERAVFSWSADHRVVDGATLARAAEVLKGFVEGPEGMLVFLR